MKCRVEKEEETSRFELTRRRFEEEKFEEAEKSPLGKKKAKMHPASTPIPIAAAIRDPRLVVFSLRPTAIVALFNFSL